MATSLPQYISEALLLLFYLLIFYNHLAYSIQFNITRFDRNETDVIYLGDAEPYLGTVELIHYLDQSARVGRLVYADRVRLWDADTKQVSDFNTSFSFIIDTRHTSYADGLAFFMSPFGLEIPFNSANGYLGLFNTTTIGGNVSTARNQIVHVEFDTVPNWPYWDPPFEHVGININSISSEVYTPWNASFHSGDTGDVWINYNATSMNLSVSWAYRSTSSTRENTTLSHRINLMDILPEWVTIGFSAATGMNKERNIIKSWEFSSSLDVKDSAGHTEKLRLTLGLTISGAILMAAGLITAFVTLWKQMKKKREAMLDAEDLTMLLNKDLEDGAGPRRFSYTDLVSATNNFSEEGRLGEGGFGAVYKGYLEYSNTEVAVKKISKGSRQGRKEYVTEVKVISRLRHRNLVQLMGWCHDRGEFLLVYEFMPNGSLDSHLFRNRSLLSWDMRYKIALGLASALLYLHEEWEQCVVHRDIKPSNIMLDSGFNTKLGDFGLARLVNHELGPQTTVLAGTLGYLAPEYIRTGRVSKESDVYSFGLVLLEIATGRKSVSVIQKDLEMGLMEWVWDLYGKGVIFSTVDERLQIGHHDLDLRQQVECLMIVGLWCAHPDRRLRPSIRQAINVLKCEATLPKLPSKMPVPMFDMPATPSVSSNEISTSLEAGR